MRALSIIVAAGVLAVLAACAPRQVDETPPTVTYAFESRRDYESVAEQADRYCDERYDLDAELVDRRRVSGGYEAIFACD